jgi:hypothetical protein
MSRVLIGVGVAAALGAAGCARTSHYQANAFTWSGAVPAGQWVHVHNTNGTISVVAGTGANVEVHASKRWSRNGDAVHFVESAGPDGVTICVLYRAGDTCSPDNNSSDRHHGLFSSRGHSSDARVDFVVDVPASVNVDLASINGSVQASGTSGSVEAKVVNGDINIASHQGSLDLVTVNGNVTAALDTLPATGDISLKSVNGSITAVLPPQLAGFVNLETVAGSVSNGFAISSDGPVNPRHLSGTIGTGGTRHVDLSTVHGTVTLLKHA